jgi:hypothetical protein
MGTANILARVHGNMGVAGEKVTCSKCPFENDYSAVWCRCGEFLGFPNFRAAIAERPELTARYQAARTDAKTRGIERLLDQLEALADAALPVIAMTVDVCDLLLRGAKYESYSQGIMRKDRAPARQMDHGDRMAVNERLFPNYGQHIVFAALSTDGTALDKYGAVAVTWNVTPHYLGRRATLLEENSYVFYERHKLGSLRGPGPPQGFRAVWDDRKDLVVAKIEPNLTPATPGSSLPESFLSSGASKMDDNYIEVTIYADDDGLDALDVARVWALKTFADADQALIWARVQEVCKRRRIPSS